MTTETAVLETGSFLLLQPPIEQAMISCCRNQSAPKNYTTGTGRDEEPLDKPAMQ
jgi:hypothetical protein